MVGIVFWMWPLVVIVDNLHGALGWILGIGAELAWIAVAGAVWTTIKNHGQAREDKQ